MSLSPITPPYDFLDLSRGQNKGLIILVLLVVLTELGIMMLATWMNLFEVLPPVSVAIIDASILSLVIVLAVRYSIILPNYQMSQNRLNFLVEIMENSPAGLLVVNNHCTIEYTNPAFLSLLGYEADEVAHASLHDIFPDEVHLECGAFFSSASAGMQRQEHEFQVVRKNGSTFPAGIAIHRVTVDNEIYLIVQIHDLTVMKKQHWVRKTLLTLQLICSREQDQGKMLQDFLEHVLASDI